MTPGWHDTPDTGKGAADVATGNARRSMLEAILASMILSLAALPFPATAATQEVTVPAGPFLGELQCPDRNRTAPTRSPQRQEDLFEPPGNEDLAGLPIRDEAYPQDVFLGERKRTDPSKPFSIGFWGDSHAAAGYFSEELMRALGLTRDMVQPTFIPPTMDRSGVHLPIHKYCQSTGWSFEYAYTSGQANADYTKGLVNLKSNVPNSYLWVDFRLKPPAPGLRALDMLYVPPARGERTLVGISADDGAERIVGLDPEGNGVIHIRTERPVSIIKLRLIVGTLVLQGFVPRYVEKPALYLDTLGIPGATVRGWKASNSEYLRTRGNDISYDLVILEYGTNEGNDPNLDLGRYTADLRASLKNLRQVYPDSMCVLIGPTDRGVLVRRSSGQEHQYSIQPAKNFFHYSQIHQRIGELQAAIGREYSCAFWSWQDAMGGPGGAYWWLRHSPALMAKDLIHLSAPGYQLSARRFAVDTKLTNYVRTRPD